MILTKFLDIFMSRNNVNFFPSIPGARGICIIINPLNWKHLQRSFLKTAASSDKTEPRPAACMARCSLSLTNVQYSNQAMIRPALTLPSHPHPLYAWNTPCISGPPVTGKTVNYLKEYTKLIPSMKTQPYNDDSTFYVGKETLWETR